ncbi:MAG TPA: MFS transporter [Dehalococcoidia bacterium]|nr:MFS transporter [Dehalococcoidia bacterium]
MREVRGDGGGAGTGRRVIELGLAANWQQFALLVAVNAFVGGMVGLERSILPVLAHEEFGVGSATAAVSFVATFGLAKALANLFAGRLSERFSRRRVLIAGWLFGIPVPLLLMFAPSWGWVIGANVLLGLNQGLAWSMTVNMKMDLAGPERRGMALGMNEAAGYFMVAVAAFLSGAVAERYGLRPEPFYLGVAFAAGGLALSALFVRDTAPFVRLESDRHAESSHGSLRRAFAEGTWRRRHLAGVSQAGFVNNLNDALAWGIFPLFFVQQGLSLERVGILAAAYPLVWSVLQLGTGPVSDAAGRKPLIVGGLLLQAGAIFIVAAVDRFAAWLGAVLMLGVGTAMVYPALLAAIGDAVHPAERATAVGIYRFWRDGGAVGGALLAGAVADAFSLRDAILVVAAVTAGSGLVASVTVERRKASQPLPGEPAVETMR